MRYLQCADLVLDDDAHRVTRAGEDGPSPTEYNLLHFLLANQGRVVSKAQILDHVWHYDFGGDGGVVETYIGYLRRKVDAVQSPRLIHTIRRRRLRAARAVEVPSVVAAAGPVMSLRTRLLVGLGVVALVLSGVAVAITRAAECYLVAQVDDRLPALDDDSGRFGGPPDGGNGDDRGGPPPSDGSGAAAPPLSPYYVGVVTGDDVEYVRSPDVRGPDAHDTADAAPAVDADAARGGRRGDDGQTFTVGSDPAGERFRVRATGPATTGRSVSPRPRSTTSTPPSAG